MQFLALFALVQLALSAPTGEERLAALNLRDSFTGTYIVKLKNAVSTAGTGTALALLNGEPENIYTEALNGFSAKLDEETLQALRRHPDVEYIDQAGMSSGLGFVSQPNPVYGLARVSNRRTGGTSYTYDDSAGRGVCIYSLDTGVDDNHPDFEGRAKQLKSWISGSNRDDNGHGTHTAGTAASKTYGVAKKATVYGFKVLNSQSVGPDSGIIAAIDEVPRDAATRNCPNGIVVNLSLGADSYLQSMNDAVANLVRKGIFVAIAAGNANTNAARTSPASEPLGCTAGASDSNDNKAFFSNYGAALDIQAPGVGVTSLSPGGGRASMSGTSMAAPHVAGLGAYLMALEGIRGEAVCNRIKALATKDAIRNVPSGTTRDVVFNGNPRG